MATLIRRLLVFSDGSLRVELPEVIPPPPSSSSLFRVPHDTERVNVNTDDFRYRPYAGMSGSGPVRQIVLEKGVPRPEVYRVFPDHQTPIREDHQWLWRWLNPGLPADKHCTLYGNALAWTNNTGFPGRRNYVMGKDLDAEKDPAFHAPIVNGGQIVEGQRVGSQVFIKSLLVGAAVPSADQALVDQVHRWSWGTSINPQGEIRRITRLGLNGSLLPVRVLWMTSQPVWLPANELHALGVGEWYEPTVVVHK
jgi:hypothetical protein